jgi:hypothetical protein
MKEVMRIGERSDIEISLRATESATRKFLEYVSKIQDTKGKIKNTEENCRRETKLFEPI